MQFKTNSKKNNTHFSSKIVKTHFYISTPLFPTIFKTLSIDSSKDKLDVSSKTASSACFKGEIFLFISCKSRFFMSLSTFSKITFSPLAISWSYLRLALKLIDAVRKILTEAFHTNATNFTKEEVINTFCEKIKDLSEKVGITQTVKDVGGREEDFEMLADKAMQDPCKPGNPREVSKEEFINLYRQAF